MNKGMTLRGFEVFQGSRCLLALEQHVAPGEVLTIMGPSGSGKSTLLAALIGTLPRGFRMTGSILLDGIDVTGVPTHRRGMGLLFQEDLLFPHLSVADNLAFGLRPEIRGRANRRQAVTEALAEIGLEGFEARDPATLSGGQKARVALMRVLLSGPRALLLDEPFSKLDVERRAQIRSLVFGHAAERGLPVVLVTHDVADAEAARGRIVRIGGPCGDPCDAA